MCVCVCVARICEFHLQECKRRCEKRARDLYHSAHIASHNHIFDLYRRSWTEKNATFDGRPATFDRSGKHGHKTRINDETGLKWTFSGMNWAGLVHVFTRTFGTSLNESSLRYCAWPSPQNTWTAPFEERHVARHGLRLRPIPVFVNAILHGIPRATLGPCIAVSTPRVGLVRHEPPTRTFSHTMHFLLHSP